MDSPAAKTKLIDVVRVSLGDVLLAPDCYTFVEHHWACYNEWYNKYLDTLNLFIANKEIDSIIDLGANTGSITGFLLRVIFQSTKKWPAKVVAVEPNDENFDYLISTLSHLRSIAKTPPDEVDINIGIMPAACFYSSSKTSSMSFLDDNRGGYFVSDVGSLKEGEVTKLGRDVALMTIEDILETAQISEVDLLKMDIEGAEWNVIENSTALKNNVSNIIIEIHDKTIGEARLFFATHLPMFEIFAIEHEQFFLQRVKQL
jgi:FkbM family methyltransferase